MRLRWRGFTILIHKSREKCQRLDDIVFIMKWDTRCPLLTTDERACTEEFTQFISRDAAATQRQVFKILSYIGLDFKYFHQSTWTLYWKIFVCIYIVLLTNIVIHRKFYHRIFNFLLQRNKSRESRCRPGVSGNTGASRSDKAGEVRAFRVAFVRMLPPSADAFNHEI